MSATERTTSLNELAKEIHRNAVDHGWWDDERTFGDIIALCHSELSEALEEYRAGRPRVWFACTEGETPSICEPADEFDCLMYGKEESCKYKSAKPEGIAMPLR